MLWQVEPAPARPLISRRKVRDAAISAYMRVYRATGDIVLARREALEATLAMEPRWGTCDAYAHYRRFVGPLVPSWPLWVEL